MSPSRATIAVDNGSGVIKCGFAGDSSPRALLPTRGLAGASSTQPMVGGVVQDWDQMETYWDHAFTSMLQIDTEEVNIMITAHTFETKDNRERLMQSLFESFAAPAVFVAPPPVFELYASGRENGVVVGVGEQVAYALLVHEGQPDPRTLVRSSVAGEALTAWAARRLHSANHKDGSKKEGEVVGSMEESVARALKEQLGTLLPLHGEGECAKDQTYTLPDGRTLTASAETCAAIAEPLFDPSLVGVAGGSLTEMVGESIRLRDRDGALESTVAGLDGTAAWYATLPPPPPLHAQP